MNDAKNAEDKLSLLYRQNQEALDAVKDQNKFIAKMREDHRREVEELKRSAASVSFPGKPQLEGLIDKIVTTKLQAFAKKVAAAINNKFAAAIQKTKTNANSLSELENTLNMWPRQLQVAVYEPLNALTSKVGNLQKMLEESKKDVEMMRLRCEELEKCLERLKIEESNGTKLADSVSQLRRRVEELNVSSESTQSLESRMKHYVDRLKKELVSTSPSETKHMIDELERRMKIDVEQLKRQIDLSKDSNNASAKIMLKDLEERMSTLEGSELKENLEKLLDERYNEFETQFLKRSEKTKSEVETFILESIRKSQDEMTAKFVNQSKMKNQDITPRVLFESPEKEKEVPSSVIRTPDVERTLGKILGDESSDGTPHDVGTPDVERLVGKILDDDTKAAHTASLRKLRDEIEESNRDVMDEMRASLTSSLSRHCETVALKISTDTCNRELERAQAAQEKYLREHLNEIEISNRKRTEVMRTSLASSLGRHCESVATKGMEANQKRLNLSVSMIKEEFETSRKKDRSSFREQEMISKRVHEDVLRQNRMMDESIVSVRQQISSLKRYQDENAMKIRDTMESNRVGSEEEMRRKEAMRELKTRFTEKVSILEKKILSADANNSNIAHTYSQELERAQATQLEHLRNVRLESEEHASALDQRLAEWSRRIAKSVQTHQKRQNLSMTSMSEEFEAFRESQAQSFRDELETSHAESLKNVEDVVSRRIQTDMARQKHLLDESLGSTREQILNLKRCQDENSMKIRDAIEWNRESSMKKEQDDLNVDRNKERDEMIHLFTENLESLEERLRNMQTSESKCFDEKTSRIRNVLLKNQMNLSDRLETRTEILSQSLDRRLEMLEERTSNWREDVMLAQESRVCSEISNFEDSLQCIRSDLETLNLRVDSGHQQARQEAATLRARHVDVVDALVRTKRCQAEMSRTTSSCHAIEESLKRIRSRLSAAEKRLPEMQEQIVSTADGFHESIVRLSEDIGTVSCSVADLKMSVAGPSLAPLVVNDSQLL